MTINTITQYIQERPDLIKIEIVSELGELASDFLIIKTKETYSYGTEEEADAKIDELRRSTGFIGVEKKYKAGKMSKTGEELKPEVWLVIAKVSHEQ